MATKDEGQKPGWLGQVKEIVVKPHHADGRSEAGAVLSAIAEELTEEPYAAGEVIAAGVNRGDAGTEFSVLVSSGDAMSDMERVAAHYDVKLDQVYLMAAADMLTQQYDGLATCSTTF